MKHNFRTRYDFINYFIEQYKYESYLEIGYLNGDTFNNINITHKESIDPNATHVTYRMTSDQFFRECDPNKKYDLIFIDGDHSKEAVKRDIENSLKHLNKNGTIICHDVNPESREQLQERYCNNAWEEFVRLRMTRTDLYMYVVDFNMFGVIRPGKQTLYKLTDDVDEQDIYNWGYLSENRIELLNQLTWEQFFDQFKPKPKTKSIKSKTKEI